MSAQRLHLVEPSEPAAGLRLRIAVATQDMKSLLEGKNMTCVYEKGDFDPQLVNSLVEGTENCTGDLKVDLARLIVFSQ